MLQNESGEKWPIRVDESQVTDIKDQLEEAVRRGTPEQEKALLRALVAEIKVEGKVGWPSYRLPRAGVRIVETLVGRSLYNANRELMVSGSRIEL